MNQTLVDLIQKKAPAIDVAVYLDSLAFQERYAAIKMLTKKHLVALYNQAKTGASIFDLVAKKESPLKEFIFWGKNSLPFFSDFQKRFCLSADKKFLIGYNHQNLKSLTGPGYFIASEQTDKAGEIMIDYTKIPMDKPAEWPMIKSNETGIAALVYGGMKDFLKPVSRDVFIGEAQKKGRPMGQYFALCRDNQ